jgi:hypothetical protein
MSERCGRIVREWFKQFYGTGEKSGYGAQTQTGYSNHYNSALNRCFALLSTTATTKDAKTGRTSLSDSKSLTDVNDNKDVGSYFRFISPDHMMMCDMDGKHCSSSEEWDAWAQPYMEQ